VHMRVIVLEVQERRVEARQAIRIRHRWDSVSSRLGPWARPIS